MGHNLHIAREDSRLWFWRGGIKNNNEQKKIKIAWSQNSLDSRCFFIHIINVWGWDRGKWKFLNLQQIVTKQDTRHNEGNCGTLQSWTGEGRQRLGWMVWTANRTETLSKVFSIQHRKPNFLPITIMLKSIYGNSLPLPIIAPRSYWEECKCLAAFEIRQYIIRKYCIISASCLIATLKQHWPLCGYKSWEIYGNRSNKPK